MSKHIITIRQMGQELCKTLILQAMGIPDVKQVSNFMSDKVALLLFARESLPERLCCTAAVRQLGGTTIYEGSAANKEWQSQESRFQSHLLPIFGYYFDCLYLYNVKLDAQRIEKECESYPVINAGCATSHPVNALADIACMLKTIKNRTEVINTAWIGNDNGTLYSLIEASRWFAFNIKVSVPPECDISALKERVKELEAPVQFVASPEEAVANAQFIYAGRFSPDNQNSQWEITPELLKKSLGSTRVLLSASPIRAIKISEEVLDSGRAMLTLQAQYRLAIHKRILHWVFSR